MCQLTVIEYISLDWVAHAPGHAEEYRDGDFTAGGWTHPSTTDHGRYMREALATVGRGTPRQDRLRQWHVVPTDLRSDRVQTHQRHAGVTPGRPTRQWTIRCCGVTP